jgi:hypothetical protein
MEGKQGALLGGGLSLLAALMLLWLTPRPLELLHLTGALAILPPLWLLAGLHLLWYLAVGALSGLLWAERFRRGGGEALWRGNTFFVWGITAASVWYILLFGKGLLLLSWLFLPVAAAALVIAVWCRFPWHRGAAAVGAACVAWPLLLFFWQMLCIFSS